MKLHHVSLACSNLDASRRFYGDVLGLREFERPAATRDGAWFRIGEGQELHLILRPEAAGRGEVALDSGDSHFALATEDCEAMLERLRRLGFSEHLDRRDEAVLLVLRAGEDLQLFLFDPDRNVVELNGRLPDDEPARARRSTSRPRNA